MQGAARERAQEVEQLIRHALDELDNATAATDQDANCIGCAENYLDRALAAIRALSCPDHIADAGKLVEGDGWPTGEYEVDYEVICNGEWVAGSTDLNDAKHYAAVYSHDGEIEIVEARTYRRPLPTPPEASV